MDDFPIWLKVLIYLTLGATVFWVLFNILKTVMTG